jgi:hypothetical protein
MDGQDIRIDPGRSATYCIGGDDVLWLGRPTTGDTAGLRRRGNVRTVAWPAGAPQIEWPDDVMIEDGDQFEIIDGRGNPNARITFRRFAKRPRDETAWLAETVLLGCAEQARTPLRELARSSVAPELYLGTDRGRHPVYRAGEPIRLIVQANLDGQLYCFARTGNDDARAIFPAGAPGSARIPGHRPILLPADNAGAQAEMRARAGGENIQCYFADRDIGGELPAALLDGAAPLPQALAADLDTIFAAVPLTRVAKASLAVGVE